MSDETNVSGAEPKNALVAVLEALELPWSEDALKATAIVLLELQRVMSSVAKALPQLQYGFLGLVDMNGGDTMNAIVITFNGPGLPNVEQRVRFDVMTSVLDACGSLEGLEAQHRAFTCWVQQNAIMALSTMCSFMLKAAKPPEISKLILASAEEAIMADELGVLGVLRLRRDE